MKKIPTLFVRDHATGRISDEITPGLARIVAGFGNATRKWDGTACLFRGGKWWKRYDAKRGKIPPVGFVPCGEPDLVTGHNPGWIQVGDGPGDRWHREAIGCGQDANYRPFEDERTYELCGPKLQGNPENLTGHWMIPHGELILAAHDRSFIGLREWFESQPIEGLVFWEAGAPVCKIKRRDFGFPWPVKP